MKKTIFITLVVACVLVLTGCGSSVSQQFIDKHNEIVALGKEAEQIANLEKSAEMDTLSKQMDSEDYTEAIKTIEVTLSKKKDASSKFDLIDSKLIELTTLSSDISNAKVKVSADKFIDVAKKENSVKIKYNDLQIQMLEKTKLMVEILVKDDMDVTDEKTIDSLVKEINDTKDQFDVVQKEANDIQQQYEIAENEFFSLANLQINE